MLTSELTINYNTSKVHLTGSPHLAHRFPKGSELFCKSWNHHLLVVEQKAAHDVCDYTAHFSAN